MYCNLFYRRLIFFKITGYNTPKIHFNDPYLYHLTNDYKRLKNPLK